MATERVQFLDAFRPRFCKSPKILNWSKWILLIDIPTQILLTIMGSIDYSSRWTLDVYVIAYIKEKPCTTNWYLSQKLYGNESQMSEQKLSENIYYWFPFTLIKNLKSLVSTRTKTVGIHLDSYNKKEPSKIANIEDAILLFPHQNTFY